MNGTEKTAENDKPIEQYLLEAMDYCTECLIELNAAETDGKLSPEQYGRKCALVEVMERLMAWPDAERYGYDWDVEEEFPV